VTCCKHTSRWGKNGGREHRSEWSSVIVSPQVTRALLAEIGAARLCPAAHQHEPVSAADRELLHAVPVKASGNRDLASRGQPADPVHYLE
jgi:hypothetical protein